MQELAPKVNLVTALLGQADTLIRDEISARYSVEMSKARDQNSETIAKQTAQYEMQFRQKQWEYLQLDKMAERITGLTLAALREVAEDLVTVVNRANEIKQEIRSRKLLSPSLLAALDISKDAEVEAAKKELSATIDDTPVLEDHYARLSNLANKIASGIEYREFQSDALEISFGNVARN